jgi:hypothetical protein
MKRVRFISTVILALVTVSARAATLVDTDFTLQDRARAPVMWQTNGTAGLDLNLTGSSPLVSLALTHNLTSEAGTAWTMVKARVPSFTMWADVNLDYTANNGVISGFDCPADGFTLAFANVTPDAVGPSGQHLGLFGSEEVINRFIAFEINTWREQALEGSDDCSTHKFTTFSFANVNLDTGVERAAGAAGTPEAGGAKVAQTTIPAGLKVVNAGWFRYQWNVDTTSGAMSAYLTGLEEGSRSFQNVKLAEVQFGPAAPKIDFTGRWGITAATGGAVMGARVAHVRIDAPMLPPGAPPP